MKHSRPLLSVMLLACAALSSAASSLGAQESAPEEDSVSSLDWYGDLRLRQERTQDIPNRADALERTRAAVRTGLRFINDGGWEFAAAVKLAAGTDENDDNQANLDNEKSNGAGLDEAYAAYAFSDSGAIRVGKSSMPLVLSPLLWDRDLRPVGASLDYSREVRGFDALHLTAGYFAGDHLYGDDSRIGAVQIGYGWMEGAESGFSTFLSYLDFSDLDVIERELARTNRRVAGAFVSDYELLDLQFIGRVAAFDKPLVARLDLVRNLGAKDLRDGARFSLVWGDAQDLGGWELGYAYQRAQRDAVLAAFTEDDWWFHSFARGYMPWVAYGFNQTWNLQLTGFIERRDAIEEPTDRWLLDLRSRW